MKADYCVEAAAMLICLAGNHMIFNGSQRFRLRHRIIKIPNKAEVFLRCLSNTGYMKHKRGEKADMEIYESISFMRNIMALGNGRNISADHLISQLAERDSQLKTAYIKMLSMLRVNKKAEAAEAFSDEAGTVMGREFAGLLIQWDELDPAALSEILLSHQKNIKEVRVTARKKRDEAISDLIYLPVVANVMMICINCIYTTYYLQQQEMFGMFF